MKGWFLFSLFGGGETAEVGKGLALPQDYLYPSGDVSNRLEMSLMKWQMM